LNNICIGDCRVWAREARFDRFAQFDEADRSVRSGGSGVRKGVVVITHGAGVKNVRVNSTKVEERVDEGEKIVKVGC
jgi:hypothetical protein